MFLNAFLTRFLNDELQIRRFLLEDWFSSVNGQTVLQLGRFIFGAVCSARSGFMFGWIFGCLCSLRDGFFGYPSVL